MELKSDFSTPTVPPGSGARHLVFSRDGRFVHVINEMACTVTTLAWNAKDGTLAPVETVSTLPASIPLQNSFTAAEILVHPSGKYVYATVRDANIVSVFKADPKTGKLTWLQSIDSGGRVPRGLGIDPTGHWLITGNQKSDNAVEFAINIKTGLLDSTGRELKLGAPVDVKFIRAR
jgi:6-phosphogluconolactonase